MQLKHFSFSFILVLC